ncbi:hypothetical protein H0H87_004651 [Tephrocybe sp. NHM501043]|nr:hypothetical protein H0H87_004651 [Tephrocybe sp. NHM501043]
MSNIDPEDNESDDPRNKKGVVGARSVKDPIHDMSVAYLARSMASHLQANQPDLGITDRDIECVEIAGLCHDLGHGPWSHVWDGLFIPKAMPGSTWKHEDASVMMFDYLVNDNKITLDLRDNRFIKALIDGDPTKCSPNEKRFLFDIVANKRNGLDVDKFDYIPRDSHMIGDKMNIALMRIINSARVLDDQICYDIKDANLIYEICATRFKLHKMVYSHKAGIAAKAIEHMIIDALLLAEPIMKIAEQVNHPEKYVYLTDDIMGRIEANPDPRLAPAQAIFERIRTRDLYRMVDFKVIDFPWDAVFRESITPEKIVAAVKTLSGEEVKKASVATIVSKLRVEDVICDFSMMHYGMKEHNPLDFVKFYSKRHPDKPEKAERGVYSNLMPQFHAELLIRIYTKTAESFGVVQAGYRKCLAAIPTQLDEAKAQLILKQTMSESSSSSMATELTPPPDPPGMTTPPRGKRTLSRVSSFKDDATFSNNSFTTVAPSFVPPSPTRGGPKKRRKVDTVTGHA